MLNIEVTFVDFILLIATVGLLLRLYAMHVRLRDANEEVRRQRDSSEVLRKELLTVTSSKADVGQELQKSLAKALEENSRLRGDLASLPFLQKDLEEGARANSKLKEENGVIRQSLRDAEIALAARQELEARNESLKNALNLAQSKAEELMQHLRQAETHLAKEREAASNARDAIAKLESRIPEERRSGHAMGLSRAASTLRVQRRKWKKDDSALMFWKGKQSAEVVVVSLLGEVVLLIGECEESFGVNEKIVAGLIAGVAAPGNGLTS